MDTILILPVGDMMVIIVHLMLMMVPPQMMHIEQVQKVPHPLSQKRNKDKTSKIDMQY